MLQLGISSHMVWFINPSCFEHIHRKIIVYIERSDIVFLSCLPPVTTKRYSVMDGVACFFYQSVPFMNLVTCGRGNVLTFKSPHGAGVIPHMESYGTR